MRVYGVPDEGFSMDTYSMPPEYGGGYAVLVLPRTVSPEDYHDIQTWIDLCLRRLGRNLVAVASEDGEQKGGGE